MFNRKGRFGLATLACVGLAIAISTPAAAWERGSVENFTAPSGSPMMEGLTVGRDGNVYVSTFDPTGSTGEPAQVLTFSPDGTLLNRKALFLSTPFPGETQPSTAMLGVAFPPGMDALYVIDFGKGNVLSVNPKTGASSVCITLDQSQEHTGPGLNALTFDAAGNTYVSDSFAGIIWKLNGKACGPAEAWVPENDLLKPNPCTNSIDPTTCNSNSTGGFFGIPPFGANGVEFDSKGDMFVCNTAFDTIVKIPVTGGMPGTPVVFTNSINGCDGIAIDKSDNIWAAANQADEIVVVNPSGKAIAKLGDFDGVQGGVTSGLLFPASPAFSKDGQSLFVTNLELDLRTILPFGPLVGQTVDSQWAAKVKQHSIAKLEAQIPQASGNSQ